MERKGTLFGVRVPTVVEESKEDVRPCFRWWRMVPPKIYSKCMLRNALDNLSQTGVASRSGRMTKFELVDKGIGLTGNNKTLSLKSEKNAHFDNVLRLLQRIDLR